MATAGWCLPCRAAKIKCDLSRPVCGRCAREGLACSGLPLDSALIFRNENEVAKRNSQRARRERGPNPVTVISGSSLSDLLQQNQAQQAPAEVTTKSLQRQYSWLNERALAEVPGPLKRDVETRAVERFFVNWTLYPGNHGAALGHMHELPMLFHDAPQDSVLWLAVRAAAFADMRNEGAGSIAFPIRAREYYGEALNRMRTVIRDSDVGDDRILFAMLLIDNFELVHLARGDLLGPHSNAIKHVLYSRSDDQFYNPSRFSLWRLTHFRLQFWQTLFREQPDDRQVAWVNKLNMERPDARICTYVLHMNILSALAKTLTHEPDGTGQTGAEKLDRARQLAQEMLNLTSSIEGWMSEITEIWKANAADPQNIAKPQDVDESPNDPIPYFPYPHLLIYEDLWLAYIWNFHAASQIVFRESLVDVLEFAATLGSPDVAGADNGEVIEKQRNSVDRLSASIMESFPQLLGFAQNHTHLGLPRVPQQGKMAGRLFALFSMWAIQRARFTSAQHKQTASEVVAWIHTRHELG